MCELYEGYVCGVSVLFVPCNILHPAALSDVRVRMIDDMYHLFMCIKWKVACVCVYLYGLSVYVSV